MAQRPHPGHRRRRGRAPAVPLPRPVAGPAGRREARAGARDRPPAARRPGRRRGRRCAPAGSTATGCWPPPSGCSTSAPSASAASSTRRRTAPTGWPRCKRDARVGARRADVLLLHREGRHRARGRDHRPADGRPSSGSCWSGPADAGEDLLGLPDRATATWRDVTSTEINAYLKEISGAEITAKDFRTWTATVLMAAALAEAPPPTSRTARKKVGQRRLQAGVASSWATRRRCARPATSTRGWSTGSRTGRPWPTRWREAEEARRRPGRPAGARGGRLPAAVRLTRTTQRPRRSRRGLLRGAQCRRCSSAGSCRAERPGAVGDREQVDQAGDLERPGDGAGGGDQPQADLAGAGRLLRLDEHGQAGGAQELDAGEVDDQLASAAARAGCPASNGAPGR